MNWKFWKRSKPEPVWLATFETTYGTITVFTPESYWMNLTLLWPIERNRMKVTLNREHPEYDVTP